VKAGKSYKKKVGGLEKWKGWRVEDAIVESIPIYIYQKNTSDKSQRYIYFLSF